MQSIQQVSKQTLTLEQFFKTLPEGYEITYLTIQKETGVSMDLQGKAFLRTALKRCKIPYEVFRGQGIRLLCPTNAMRIVSHKTIKIDRATRKAEKTNLTVIGSNSFDRIDPQNKQRLTGLASLFATIRLFSNTAKKIFYNQDIKIGESVNK